MTTINENQTESDFPQMLEDYKIYKKAEGNNFFDLDPNLQFILKRTLNKEEELKIAETIASTYGQVVGEKIAPRADFTDRHGPVLKSYDEWGYPLNEVIHSDTWLDNKADLVKIGICSLQTGDLPERSR